MKIKDEYIDSFIIHPHSGRTMNVRFGIDPANYEYYYNNGYKHIFEEEEIQPIKEPENDIPESE